MIEWMAADGPIVKTMQMEKQLSSFKLDISGLPHGLYIARFSSGKGSVSKKVIVGGH